MFFTQIGQKCRQAVYDGCQILRREAFYMWKEFKAFALKGNVIDLAVGVIIGGAFGKIVTSLVNDLIMPLIGLITGGMNFNNQFLLLKKAPDGVVVKTLEDAKTLALPTLNYGSFITNVLDFLIMAFVIFFFIKMLTNLTNVASKKLKKGETASAPAPATKECPFCRTEIHIEASRCPHCTSKLDEK
jgi:large conductance mechanosensitive channel